MKYFKRIAGIAIGLGIITATPVFACGISGMAGDCDAACKNVPAGWQHTTCIISSARPADVSDD